MWFKLAKATFKDGHHLGPMSKLSNQVQIEYEIEGFDADTTSVSKKNENTTTIILTLKDNYTYTHNTSNVTVVSNFVSVSGTPSYNSSTKKLTIVLTKPTEQDSYSIKITVSGAKYTPPTVEPTQTYKITYKYMSDSTKLQNETEEQVPAGTKKTFSIQNAPSFTNYTCTSVDPSGEKTIDKDTTVTYNYTANAASGTTVQLTSSKAVFTTTEYHLAATNPGGPLVTSTQGTKGVMAWDIPAKALVTLTCSPNGNYGMAMTNSDGTVALETLVNSSVAINEQNGTYTFSPVLEASRLYVSTTKFVSASYVILTDEELKQYEFNVTFEFTSNRDDAKYINTSQTVGTDVKFADMGGTQYAISNIIPANSVITLNVKSGGNYGMCIADENGKVLQNKPSNQANADGNIIFDKQSVPCKLWVSMTKYNKATYKLGG